MPTLASRRIVQSHASGRKAYVHIQQLTGVTTGQGFSDGGTWTDVPGLSNVPVTFKTWSPFQRVMAQELYSAVSSHAYMRWRRGVNIRANMRVVYGSHIYRIADVSNYDEANTDIILWLEEWQATGTVR
jgi:Phage head-tail joining protein